MGSLNGTEGYNKNDLLINLLIVFGNNENISEQGYHLFSQLNDENKNPFINLNNTYLCAYQTYLLSALHSHSA